jgi:hypothetical protein
MLYCEISVIILNQQTKIYFQIRHLLFLRLSLRLKKTNSVNKRTDPVKIQEHNLHEIEVTLLKPWCLIEVEAEHAEADAIFLHRHLKRPCD